MELSIIMKIIESDITRCMELSIIMKIIESDIRGFIESCTKYKQDVIVGVSPVDSLILHPVCMIVESLLSVFVTMEGSLERLMSLSG
jgi:hypothetical protein